MFLSYLSFVFCQLTFSFIFIFVCILTLRKKTVYIVSFKFLIYIYVYIELEPMRAIPIRLRRATKLKRQHLWRGIEKKLWIKSKLLNDRNTWTISSNFILPLLIILKRKPEPQILFLFVSMNNNLFIYIAKQSSQNVRISRSIIFTMCKRKKRSLHAKIANLRHILNRRIIIFS